MSQMFNLREKSTGKYIEWKVKDFFSVTRKKIYSLESPTFTLSDTKCCILIQPNDANTADVSAFSMVLKKNSSSSKEYGVRYSIGIKARDGSKYKSKCVRFVSKVGGSGPKADDGKKDNGMIVELTTLRKSEKDLSSDSSLMVFCDALIVDVADVGTIFSVPIWNNEDELIKNLEHLLLDGRHKDTTINVKNRGFNVHRSILSVRSSVFGLMFDQDMVEKNCGVVNIRDCEPNTFQDFLLYVYTGKTDHVTSENAPGLYRIADKYDTPLLKKECASLMRSELTIHSFCDVALIASTYDDAELMAAATTFLLENFSNIFPTVKWMELLSEQPALTGELLVTMGDAAKKRSMVQISSSTVSTHSPAPSATHTPTDSPAQSQTHVPTSLAHATTHIPSMQIFVKTFKGDNVVIDVAGIATVKKLVKEVLRKINSHLDTRSVYLTYGAKYLQMERSLFDYHIQRGSTVYLNIQNVARKEEMAGTIPFPVKRS